jgi:SAM-dependent methyltransferase
VLDAQQIDLPDASVDGVISRFGLMLVPDQQRAIAEIRRVLRPGGRCAYAAWGLPQHNPWIFQVVAALLQNGIAPPGDPFAPGGLFSLATAESNQSLAAAGGFTDVTVEELTGTMRFDDTDDYWTHIAAVAGPVAELASSLDEDRVKAIRDVLDPSLAAFEQDGALQIPWLATVTSLA